MPWNKYLGTNNCTFLPFLLILCSQFWKGKVPHVSHHVQAYLNAGEALRFSRERDERKLAREYKARCKKIREKNLPDGYDLPSHVKFQHLIMFYIVLFANQMVVAMRKL